MGVFTFLWTVPYLRKSLQDVDIVQSEVEHNNIIGCWCEVSCGEKHLDTLLTVQRVQRNTSLR